MMNRYFFDLADGDNDTDREGVELDGDDAAVLEAIRYAGSLIQHQPEIMSQQHPFTVSVRRGPGPAFAKVVMQLSRG